MVPRAGLPAAAPIAFCRTRHECIPVGSCSDIPVSTRSAKMRSSRPRNPAPPAPIYPADRREEDCFAGRVRAWTTARDGGSAENAGSSFPPAEPEPRRDAAFGVPAKQSSERLSTGRGVCRETPAWMQALERSRSQSRGQDVRSGGQRYPYINRVAPPRRGREPPGRNQVRDFAQAVKVEPSCASFSSNADGVQYRSPYCLRYLQMPS